jgi:hypothetical protein
MKYLRPEYEAQFRGVHPELVTLLIDFDEHSKRLGWPEMVLTDVWRTKEEQQAIYLPKYMEIVAKVRAGNTKRLSDSDIQLGRRLSALSDEEIAEEARTRPSWHLYRAACDIRTRHYTTSQTLMLAKWFRDRCPKPEWLFLLHDVAGPHAHIQRSDYKWRRQQAATNAA